MSFLNVTLTGIEDGMRGSCDWPVQEPNICYGCLPSFSPLRSHPVQELEGQEGYPCEISGLHYPPCSWVPTGQSKDSLCFLCWLHTFASLEVGVFAAFAVLWAAGSERCVEHPSWNPYVGVALELLMVRALCHLNKVWSASRKYLSQVMNYFANWCKIVFKATFFRCGSANILRCIFNVNPKLLLYVFYQLNLISAVLFTLGGYETNI